MSKRILILFMVCLGIVFAQGERSTFNGTVTDASGAAVPGATVVATNLGTNVETKTSTTDAGVYRLPYLPLGNF